MTQHGKQAEDALIETLNQRLAAGGGEVTLDTKIMALVDQHIERLEEDGRSVRTIDTYRYCAKLLRKIIAGVRVGEATPARLDAAIRSMRNAHGDVMAVQSKTILRGGLHLAVMANVLAANPVRDVSPMRAKSRPNGAAGAHRRRAARALREAAGVGGMPASRSGRPGHAVHRDRTADLRAARAPLGGLRRSPLTLTVSGKVVRAAGKGLMRVDETKTAAGRRTIPLPTFAATVLVARRLCRIWVSKPMIFPSSAGTWRDPDNFRARWREVRERTWGPRRHESQLPQDCRHPHRRRRTIGPDRCRSPRSHSDLDDPGQVHGPWPRPHRRLRSCSTAP